MKEQYRLIKEKVTNEIVIEKSVFICNLIPINSKEEADFYLKEINKEHYKAMFWFAFCSNNIFL